MRSRYAWLCVYAALANGGRVLAQTAVEDQAFVPSNPVASVNATVSDAVARAQTFTMGIGGILSELRYYLTREATDTADVGFSIMRTAGGAPDDSQVIFSATFPGGIVPTSPPGTGTVSLAVEGLGVVVSVGEVLAITLSRAVAPAVTWRGQTGDPYSPGAAFSKTTGGSWTATAATDLGFRIMVKPSGPELSGQAVIYPTLNGFELRDLGAGASRRVPFAGTGPGGPLPRDVDVTLTPDGTRAVYPTPPGFEVVPLGGGPSRLFAWLGPGAQTPLVGGLDAAITPDSTTTIYPTPTGFEIGTFAGSRRFAGYAGPGIGSLSQDVDVAVTPDSAHAVLPSINGFQVLDTGSGQATHVPFAGIGGEASFQTLPIGLDITMTPGGKGVFPTETGWEIVDPATKTATHVDYAGRGPILPLPVDVDAMFSVTLGRAVYPSADGFEVLDLAAGTSQLARWAGLGPPVPLPWSVDTPITRDGHTAVYPTLTGFEVLDVAEAASTFVPYAGSGPAGQAPEAIPDGVDVVITNTNRHALYPTQSGWEILDLQTKVSQFVPWGGGGPNSPMPACVDAVISGDSAFAVYPALTGFEVLTLPAGPSTNVPFAGVGPGAPPDGSSRMPFDVDAIFHADGRRLFYPTHAGFEGVDLRAGFAATFTPYAGVGPGMPLPVGVDPLIVPHEASGVPPFSQGFSNDDPGDEDYTVRGFLLGPPTGPPPPGGPPPMDTFRGACGLGQTCVLPFSQALRDRITEALPDGVVWTAAPPGTVRLNGIPNTSLAGSGFTITADNLGIEGAAYTPGSFYFRLLGTGSDSRRIKLVLDVKIAGVREFVWNGVMLVGMTSTVTVPDYLDLQWKAASPDGPYRLEPDLTPRIGPEGLPTEALSANNLSIGSDGLSITGLPTANDKFHPVLAIGPDSEALGIVYFNPRSQPVDDMVVYTGDKERLWRQFLSFYHRLGAGQPSVTAFTIQNVGTEDLPTNYTLSLPGVQPELWLTDSTSGSLDRGQIGYFGLQAEAHSGATPFSLEIGYGSGTSVHDGTLIGVRPNIVGFPLEGANFDPDTPYGFTIENRPPGTPKRIRVILYNDPRGQPPGVPRSMLTVNINDVTLVGDIDAFSNPNQTSTALGLGQGVEVPFNFMPGVSGTYRATLQTDDLFSDVPDYEFIGSTRLDEMLRVQGGDGFVPDEFGGVIDFGAIVVGTTRTVPLVFQNVATTAPNLEALRLQSVALYNDDGAFSYQVMPPSNQDTVIGPEGSLTFDMSFAPKGTGEFLGDFRVLVESTEADSFGVSDRTSTKLVTFLLIGRGLKDATLHARFHRVSQDEIELVFPVVAGNKYVAHYSSDVDSWLRAHEFVSPSTKPDFKLFLSGFANSPRALFYIECFDGPVEPLVITNITINGGDPQLSIWTDTALTFNRESNLPGLVANGGIDQAFSITPPLGSPARFTYNPGTRTLRIEPNSGAPPPPDGTYTVNLLTDAIHPAGESTNPLRDTDGVADGVLHISEGLSFLKGDLDGNGKVDAADFRILRDSFGIMRDAPPGPDLDGDGDVDLADLVTMRDLLTQP